jgi:hypothetical protein
VQGRLLDLYMWSCHEALKFGRKDVQVTVLRLGWDPRATAPTLIDRVFRGRATRKAPAPEAPPPASVAPDTAGEDVSSAPTEVAAPDVDPAGAPTAAPPIQ